MTTSRAAKLIPLAEVARPHGVRGELRLKVYNQDSDLLVSAREVTLRMPDGQTRPARLRTVRRANDALLAFLAAKLGVPRRAVALIRGDKSRHKAVRIDGLDLAAVESRLRAAT